MRRLLVQTTATLTVVLLLIPTRAATQPREACTIAKVVHDGDTLRCRELGQSVRWIGIDAPEKSQKPWGPKVQQIVADALPVGRVVYLERDVRDTDKYGRYLRYVWTAPEGGNLLNLSLAQRGLVMLATIPPNVKYADTLRRAVEEARSAGRGLWATDAFACTPSDFRKGRCQ